jgi:hypothetical protein
MPSTSAWWRGDHNRLGFAMQLTTVRYLDLFLPDPLAVPGEVVGYLAGQLKIADPDCVGRYVERRNTKFEHAEEIKAEFGLHEKALDRVSQIRGPGFGGLLMAPPPRPRFGGERHVWFCPGSPARAGGRLRGRGRREAPGRCRVPRRA